MSLERLWAGWRNQYVTEVAREPPTDETSSIFQAILDSGLPDHETYIVWRGEHTFVLLNAYPYTTGHVLVLPFRAVPGLEDLEPAESAEFWETIRAAVVAITKAYDPDGVNVGMNLGWAAGAGVPDHLHAHCLPRWIADTNFTTTVAETRVIPESLDETYRRLRAAWPTEGADSV